MDQASEKEGKNKAKSENPDLSDDSKLQPEDIKKSLAKLEGIGPRRTSRTKIGKFLFLMTKLISFCIIAKNNSEFIYYGKQIVPKNKSDLTKVNKHGSD